LVSFSLFKVLLELSFVSPEHFYFPSAAKLRHKSIFADTLRQSTSEKKLYHFSMTHEKLSALVSPA
jgi:hypothetical protein